MEKLVKLETTGQKLKSKLKLKKFSYVKIRRLVTGSSVRIYQIVFDSRRPNFPLTTYMLNNNQLMPRVISGDIKEYWGMPWADLENFNGFLNPAIFFVSDISGIYGKIKNYSEKIVSIGNRLEELTIPQLKSVDQYTSQTTQKYKDQRSAFQGQGIKNTKLLDSQHIPETGSLRFVFVTESTEIDKKKRSHKMTKSKVDQKLQFNKDTDSMEDNPSKTYDMYIQLENVFPNDAYSDLSWLEVYNGEEVDAKMMKDLLEVADVKIYDTTPAFQFQGFRYRLTQNDASLFPETRPDTFWRSKHGTQGLLDKHFSQLFDSGTIGVFTNQMTSILIKHSKQLGYAKNIGKEKKLIVEI